MVNCSHPELFLFQPRLKGVGLVKIEPTFNPNPFFEWKMSGWWNLPSWKKSTVKSDPFIDSTNEELYRSQQETFSVKHEIHVFIINAILSLCWIIKISGGGGWVKTVGWSETTRSTPVLAPYSISFRIFIKSRCSKTKIRHLVNAIYPTYLTEEHSNNNNIGKRSIF